MSSPSRPSHRHSNSFPSNKSSHTSSRATHAVESTGQHPSASTSMSPPSTTVIPLPRSNKTASRIMISVKRSLSYTGSPKKRETDFSKSGMYSTPEERNLYTPSRFGQQDPSAIRPTIEQIAMGLHISRTPHLGPTSRYPNTGGGGTQTPHHHDAAHRVTSPLPPPPARSALKKPSGHYQVPVRTPGLSAASVSSTTVTSTSPSTPHSSGSLTSLKMRMSRFLPGSSRGSSAPSSMLPSPVSSPGGSSAELHIPRKAVRFSMPGVRLEEDE